MDLDEIFHARQLKAAALEAQGILEVQTSNGLFINFEESSPIKTLDEKPAAGSNISRPQPASEPAPKA